MKLSGRNKRNSGIQLQGTGASLAWVYPAAALAAVFGNLAAARAEVLNQSIPAMAGAQTSAATLSGEDSPVSGLPIFANYYAIFFGPSVQSPSDFQVTPEGKLDANRPLLVKNYLTAGYNIDSHWAIAATGYWTWQPTQGQALQLQDPQARIANNSILGNDNWNWYGDVRAHFPVSSVSRDLDMLAGFHVISSSRSSPKKSVRIP